MLSDLENYNWKEAFKYASGERICDAGHVHGVPERTLLDDVAPGSFDREDVEEILYIEEGENDGDSWIGVFRLKDGRFACLRAWCDYTGWG